MFCHAHAVDLKVLIKPVTEFETQLLMWICKSILIDFHFIVGLASSNGKPDVNLPQFTMAPQPLWVLWHTMREVGKYYIKDGK